MSFLCLYVYCERELKNNLVELYGEFLIRTRKDEREGGSFQDEIPIKGQGLWRAQKKKEREREKLSTRALGFH